MRVNFRDRPELNGRVLVWLDSEDITWECLEADSEAGYAWCYRRGVDRAFILCADDDGTAYLALERREGTVQIQGRAQ